MWIKKAGVLFGFLFLTFFQSVRADTSVGYNELSAEQRYAVDASFIDPSSNDNKPVKKTKNLIRPYAQPKIKKSSRNNEVNLISDDYDYQMARHVVTHEKVIIVDPHTHAWGAYSANGKLIRAGLASAGSTWCPDLHRPCKTGVGTFRINSLGSSDCISSKYPLGEGGAPMPYCMYFNGSQGLHGSNAVAEKNMSHGCVRLRVSDAKWLRFNFADIGTKVVVKNY